MYGLKYSYLKNQEQEITKSIFWEYSLEDLILYKQFIISFKHERFFDNILLEGKEGLQNKLI